MSQTWTSTTRNTIMWTKQSMGKYAIYMLILVLIQAFLKPLVDEMPFTIQNHCLVSANSWQGPT